MSEKLRISSIRFRNYKAFRDYSISLNPFNVLVGPNNAGKSTVLGAIRILSEGIRRARAKSPELIYDTHEPPEQPTPAPSQEGNSAAERVRNRAPLLGGAGGGFWGTHRGFARAVKSLPIRWWPKAG